jgi:pimeloyl-ACP methyl ester carboxylesterase
MERPNLSRPTRCRSSNADPEQEGITDMTVQPNIVLVHGAWADGSSWSAVIERLQADGFVVTAPQFPDGGFGALLDGGPPSPALAHLDIDERGFAWLPEDDFVNHFAADVDPVKAKVMHAVQQPLAGSALGELMGVPAWKWLPSWFLVADGDQAIPADAERLFAKRMNATTIEVPTNHVAMVSHPDDVVALIKNAAEALA